MSCNLSLFRTEPCKDSVGGLSKIWFVNYSDDLYGDITFDSTNTDAVEAVANTPSAYEYDIKGNSSFTQNIQSSRENGTTIFRASTWTNFT